MEPSQHTRKNQTNDKLSSTQPAHQLTVITLEELKNQYHLTTAKIQLIEKDPTLTTQLCSENDIKVHVLLACSLLLLLFLLLLLLFFADYYVSAGEVQSLLVQYGMYDKALLLSRKFSLSPVPVFESLAARYAWLLCLFISLTHCTCKVAILLRAYQMINCFVSHFISAAAHISMLVHLL